MNVTAPKNPHQKNRSRQKAVRRFRWVIGTPYFVQGTSTLTEVPILYFIKFSLGMGEAGGQLFDALRQAGWFIKPVWGYISDRFSLFGYHRKSWYVLMASLATVFWGVNAALAVIGVRTPGVYLVTFNLAFATYAFVDVVCDALMVIEGRRIGRVGAFVNFQWAVLSLANAAAVYLGGWFQQQIRQGITEPWVVFMLTGIPPLFTMVVGIRNINEERISLNAKHPQVDPGALIKKGLARLSRLPSKIRDLRQKNRHIWLLILFIFFWRFSPSIGYIERSYLIDIRGFSADSFGVILAAGGVTFFASVLAYAGFVKRFQTIKWHQYLYAMVAIGILTFPLSFFLYLEPDHPWWRLFDFSLPERFNPLPGWNRYQWFRLIVQIVFGFATIPAFIIPLTIAGETVNIAYAGIGYAFLMSLSNATNMLEGVVGAALYKMFSLPVFNQIVSGFEHTLLNIAATGDERTLILEIFVYIGLFFTILTIPFIELLRRELNRRGVTIRLGRGPGKSRG
jgi:MFS family permease